MSILHIGLNHWLNCEFTLLSEMHMSLGKFTCVGIFLLITSKLHWTAVISVEAEAGHISLTLSVWKGF